MKYLGLDYGDGYIGLALADDQKLAVPLGVQRYTAGFWPYIKNLVASEGIGAIVVGWPISMSGKENERTEKTRAFMDELEEQVAVPLYREDERLTTAIAQKSGVRGRDDASAAALILQTYLDRHAATTAVR